ncbi:MAG: hypothetical protein GC161_18120 [Planctomycetaceae bacterium]|nr:hypothetical protein [Planctomycetaceae bacterium]
MSAAERDRARRLARVARVRQIEERIARAQWIEADAAAQRAEEGAARARVVVDGARRDLGVAQNQPHVDVPLLLGLTRTLGGLDRRLRRARDQARVAGGRRDQLRSIWSRAESARRALDRWLERQRARLAAEEQLREEARWTFRPQVRDAGLPEAPGSPSAGFLPKQRGQQERRGGSDRTPFER